jgi:bifunctional non-homologous end joining protein LigD
VSGDRPADARPAGDGPEDDRLHRYRSKRNFARTSEPSGEQAVVATPGRDGSRFVIQKHAARRLHYDVRFESDGVLVSWAVPKGPSLDPGEKRLAVHVEDHPLDYAGFEGTIPGGEYGAGSVIVWDEGTYRTLTEKRGRPVHFPEAVAAGHVSVWLDGRKLHGGWSLTRTSRPGNRESWIMVKRNDEYAQRQHDITAEAPDSAVTGRSLEEVKDDASSRQWQRGRATWYPPMLAQPLHMPNERRALDEGQWTYERKLDGLRCVAVRNGQEVELWSRNHLTFTGRFPDIAKALAQVSADNFTIDGEVVAFDRRGRSSFALLQRPETGTRPEFHVFDLIHLLGQDTTILPLEDRRRLLAQALDGAGEVLRTVAAFGGEPQTLLDRACADGWEGLIAKRDDSLYRSGRSPDWRKLKCSASQELVVGGWTDPAGSRIGLGALLVGYYDDAGQLQYAGKVGTGFDDKELVELHERLSAAATDASPFAGAPKVKGAHWVQPQMVVAVAFTEWTREGRLRHPRYEGIRTDKDASEVKRELLP